MIKVLLLTAEQAEKVKGTYGLSELNPVTDADGNYILGLNVLSDPDFEPVKDILSECKEIEYNPVHCE